MSFIERTAEWIGVQDALDKRMLSKYGHEFEISEQVQRRMQIRSKKPDQWTYQGMVRELTIEKKEDRGKTREMQEALVQMESTHLSSPPEQKTRKEKKAWEEIEKKASLLDRCILNGWFLTGQELIRDLTSDLSIYPPRDPTKEYEPEKSRFESVRMGKTIFQKEVKSSQGNKKEISWDTVYHYELVRPKRGMPKTFSTLTSIFSDADHVKYERTMQGMKSKTRLYNMVALFSWVLLAVTTELILVSETFTGRVPSSVVNYWIIPAAEAVFFVFILYFIVKAVMGNMYIFDVEIKPLFWDPDRRGPVPSLVESETLLTDLLTLAETTPDNITEISETMYSFQESVFSELRNENKLLQAEKTILEEKLKEEEEKTNLMLDTGRIKIRKVVPRWAFPSLAIAVILGIVLMAVVI